MNKALPNPSEHLPPPADTLKVADMVSAIESQYLSWMEELLKEGVNPNVIHRISEDNVTPLTLIETVISNIKTEKDICFSKKAIMLLLEYGLDLNQKTPVNQDEDQPILCYYASTGNLNGVKILLSVGADIEITDESGYTPLGCAIWLGHDEIIHTLLEHGAQVSPCNQVISLSKESGVLVNESTLFALKSTQSEQERQFLEDHTRPAAHDTRIEKILRL